MEKGTLGRLMMVVVIMVFVTALTQGQEKLGQTGLQILDIGMSPRAEALGGAFVVAGTEADALFYNPAGIARSTTTFDVTINRVQWFADMNYNSIGLTIRPWEGDYGVFGLSFMNGDYGDFYGTRVAAGTPAGYEDTGIFSPTAFSVGLTYARQLTDRFGIGAQAKYVTQHLGSNILTYGGPEVTNEVGGFAFDFGLIYKTPIEGFDFGMSIKNFATDFKYEQYSFEAPLTFRIGVQFRMLPLFGATSENHNFLLLADAVHPRDSGEHLDVGAEYTFQGLISLRGGYKFNYSELGITGGIGVNYDVMKGLNVRVNYSYGSFGIWSAVHRFSVGFTM
jgi:hypothetical protein